MSDLTHTIAYAPQVRAADGKVYSSVGGQLHDGERCTRLCALTPDHPTLGKFWNVEIAQTVVECEDGSITAVLNDELIG